MTERRNLEKPENETLDGAVSRIFEEYKIGSRFDVSETDRPIRFRQDDTVEFRNRVTGAVQKKLWKKYLKSDQKSGLLETSPKALRIQICLMHGTHIHKCLNMETNNYLSGKAHDATVTDVNGKSYIDAVGGLWCVNSGYGRSNILVVMAAQAADSSYVSLFSRSYIPRAQLAKEDEEADQICDILVSAIVDTNL